jgi:penicillin-binding protein 1C
VRRFARASALCLAGLAGLTGQLAAGPAAGLPTFAEVRAAHRPSDLTLLDRDGTPVQTLRMDDRVRRLEWLPLQEMSPALLQAIVLSEDKTFWQHSGVDWAAVARSAWANLWNARTRGASTVTMQLAGLIDDGLARPAGGRSVAQKLGQVLTATQLEFRWKKSEILEAYLNSVPLRGEIVGIDALAQTHFGKHASGLDTHEAAIAAALVRAPNASAERVAERACGVLKLQRLDCHGLAGFTQTALARRGTMPLGEQIAPHLARQVLRADGPAQQHSTLDARIQRAALAALRQQMAELVGRNAEDGAVIVLDNTSGDALAYVGSSGQFSDAPQIDGALARRQPGSALKPFVYGLAFERRLITPASLLDDSPAQIATTAGLYLPQNYDRDFRGWVSARTALGSSLNVPAVRVATMLGADAVFERLNALGFELPHSGGYFGHSLALGGAEVTLLALTNAYRTLANGGMAAPLRMAADARRVTPQRVLDAAATHLITDILADNEARAGTFGLHSALATRGFAAVKTGTSKDLRDNWCIGFTDRYTVGVWVGNASGEPMHDATGVSGAAPIWRTLVQQLHAGQPSRAPAMPAGVVAAAVRFDAPAHDAPRPEIFLAGTQPTQRDVASAQRSAPTTIRTTAQTQPARRFGITSPRSGSVYALDPDIPPSAQKITFEGEHGTWVLDGQRIGNGATLAWAPWPGRHVLALTAHDGREMQRVNFEVRGAAVRASGRRKPRGALSTSP